MVTKTPNIRHRRADRRHVRHSKQELAFIAEQNIRLASGAVAAAATLTMGTNPSDTQTVTVDGKVYTFQGTLTEADGHVKIGASAAASATNLFHAINKSGGVAGTDYANAVVAHTTVTATNPSGTTVKVTAKTGGSAGNSKAVTTTVTAAAWDHATLTGGAGTASPDVANLLLRNSAEAIAKATNTGSLS